MAKYTSSGQAFDVESTLPNRTAVGAAALTCPPSYSKTETVSETQVVANGHMAVPTRKPKSKRQTYQVNGKVDERLRRPLRLYCLDKSINIGDVLEKHLIAELLETGYITSEEAASMQDAS